MTEPTTEERLAALRARRPPSPLRSLPSTETSPTLAMPALVANRPGPPDQPGRASRTVPWSSSRVAATGASVVSFGAMVVAIGPLLHTVESGSTATVITSLPRVFLR